MDGPRKSQFSNLPQNLPQRPMGEEGAKQKSEQTEAAQNVRKKKETNLRLRLRRETEREREREELKRVLKEHLS